MCKAAGIEGKKTMQDNGYTFDPRQCSTSASGATDWSQKLSLDNYAIASTKRQKSMSQIVSGKQQVLKSVKNNLRWLQTQPAMYHKSPSSETLPAFCLE